MPYTMWVLCNYTSAAYHLTLVYARRYITYVVLKYGLLHTYVYVCIVHYYVGIVVTILDQNCNRTGDIMCFHNIVCTCSYHTHTMRKTSKWIIAKQSWGFCRYTTKSLMIDVSTRSGTYQPRLSRISIRSPVQLS